MDANFKKLLNDFKNICDKKWIPSMTNGHGSIGLTFEHELGKKVDTNYTPDYEGIVCPVPEAREEEYQKFVDGSSELSLSATAQGNIYVLLEPCGKTDMPAPPEFSDGFGNIGIVEVFQKTEPEHPAQSDGHIRVTGKVKVKLQRISQGSQPETGNRQQGG